MVHNLLHKQRASSFVSSPLGCLLHVTPCVSVRCQGSQSNVLMIAMDTAVGQWGSEWGSNPLSTYNFLVQDNLMLQFLGCRPAGRAARAVAGHLSLTAVCAWKHVGIGYKRPVDFSFVAQVAMGKADQAAKVFVGKPEIFNSTEIHGSMSDNSVNVD